MPTEHRGDPGTPLPKKLGIREGSRLLVIGAPAGFDDGLTPLPPGVQRLRRAGPDLDVALLFATRRSALELRVPGLVRSLAPDGRLWLAWPKKATKVTTDLTFEVVQSLGLAAGLVDNKSASFTDVFQGLQFVYRLRDRPARR